MAKALQIQIWLLLLAVASPSTINITPSPASQVSSNCFSMVGTACTQCNFGYYIANGTCVLGASNCKTFDPVRGRCTRCYVGYTLTNDSSSCVSAPTYLLQGCYHLYNATCLSCSQNYYFNYDANCQPVDTLCKIFNYQTKRCTTCYTGYAYKSNYGRCVYSDFAFDSNCVQWQDWSCVACSHGFYIENGRCAQSNPNCASFNPINATQCSSCHRGYILTNNGCIFDPLTFNNYLCSQFDQNKQCVSCYYRSFLNSLHLCTPINPLCLYYQQTGVCLACYSGYKLMNNTCLSQQQITKDSNCAVWSAETCVGCIPWAYLDAQNVCQLVNSLCRTYDQSNGGCTSCYNGYQVKDGKCVVDDDPYCRQYANSTCSSCYQGYLYNAVSLKCEIVSTICQTVTNGQCLSCYFGYYLQDRQCKQIDPLCQNFNSTVNKCQGCYGGYQLVNNTCRTYT